jgi:hypothetical protein
MGIKKESAHKVPERKNIFEAGYSRISKAITPYFLKTSLTPNHVTIISGLFGVVGAFLLISQDYSNLIIAGVFIQIFSILDLVDGDIARAKKMQSSFGWWLDIFFDKLNDFLVILCLSLGVFFRTGDYRALLLGTVLMGFVFSIQFILVINDHLFIKDRKVNEDVGVHEDHIDPKNPTLYLRLIHFCKFLNNHLPLRHNSFLFLISFFALIDALVFGLIFMTIHAGLSLGLLISINFLKIR